MDFKAGLLALGRAWFERVAAAPDELADHPMVIEAAATGNRYVFRNESVNYAASSAFQLLTNSEDEDFWAALERYEAEHPQVGEAAWAYAGRIRPTAAGNSMGEDFDFDDPEEMHRRLPRMAALFLGTATAPG